MSKAELIAQQAAPKRQANRELLEQLDNSLRQGANLCLADFIPAHYPAPLQEHERRTFVTVGDPCTGEPTRRSVITDARTGLRRWELELVYKDGVRCCPTLHSAHDLGAIGYPAALFIYGKLKVRGSLIWDRWHVYMSEWEAAV